MHDDNAMKIKTEDHCQQREEKSSVDVAHGCDSMQQLPFATQMMYESHYTRETVYFTTEKEHSNKDQSPRELLSHKIQHVRTPEHNYGDHDDLTRNIDDSGEAQQHKLIWKAKNWVWNNALVYLLPKKFPASVKSNYLKFCEWQAVQYIAGSMSGVLSMQSMFYAVGIGAGSLPLAAALNWVIKDGLGQLGGVLFASRVSTNFDSDPKKWRVRGELALMCSTLLEICTPLFPQLFLLLGSVANIGKNVSCLASSATRAAINNSFVRMDNLADITGKSGSQAIASSLIGTGLAVIVSPVIGSSFLPVLSTFVVLSSIQLYALYRAVTLVELDTLNLQRIELIIAQFLVDGTVPNPSTVSRQERFMLSYRSLFPGQLHINPKLVDMFSTQATTTTATATSSRLMSSVHEVRSVFHNEKYLMRVDEPSQAVYLLFLKDASTVDVIKGVLNATILRNQLFGSDSDIASPGRNSHCTTETLLDTIRISNEKIDQLMDGIKESGWSTAHNFIEEKPNRIIFHS